MDEAVSSGWPECAVVRWTKCKFVFLEANHGFLFNRIHAWGRFTPWSSDVLMRRKEDCSGWPAEKLWCATKETSNHWQSWMLKQALIDFLQGSLSHNASCVLLYCTIYHCQAKTGTQRRWRRSWKSECTVTNFGSVHDAILYNIHSLCTLPGRGREKAAVELDMQRGDGVLAAPCARGRPHHDILLEICCFCRTTATRNIACITCQQS